MRDTVYVFARAPRMGTVKRRLAAGIGQQAALQFYRRTLTATLRRLMCDRRFRTVLALTPDGARAVWPRGLTVVRQGRGNLGARMRRACARHPHGRVAIVGSDLPNLKAADVALAFRKLGSAAACFGPAVDGGYWLVALGPRRPTDPFAHVRWSGEQALGDTLANFRGRKVALLRMLRDVDTVDDLHAAMNP